MVADITRNVKNKLARALDKYTQKLSEIEKKQVQDRISSIRQKYDAINRLKKAKTLEEEIDPMFFCFENLPAYGKEYWFLKFVSTDPKDNRQLLAMFGSGTNNLKINSKDIDFKTCKDGRKGFMTSWFFDSKKQLVFDEACKIAIADNTITASEKNNAHIRYFGTYPKYGFDIVKNKTKICSLKITCPKDKSNPFEFSHFFKGLFGYALINLYFDFEGTLNNKNFKGKCYVQKVIVVGPFVPWYWGRIVFSNGSVFTYYVPHFNIYKFDYRLKSNFEFYDNETKKTYAVDDIIVEKYGSKFPRWVITNNKRNIFVSMKSYSSHKFVFKRLGSFTYTEHIAQVTDVYIEGKKLDMKKLGSGMGLVEDAKGFVL